MNSGPLAGIIGAALGLPSATWAAIQGDMGPAYAGTAAGIGCFLFWAWKTPENRQIKMLTDTVGLLTAEVGGLRMELQSARKAHAEAEANSTEEISKLRRSHIEDTAKILDSHEKADARGIEERRKLREENANLRVQITQIGAGVRRVEHIVTPSTTPDPDKVAGVV